jgi:hypothetical protein
VLLVRKTAVLVGMTLLICSILTGCGASAGTSTGHLLSPDDIARQVGTYYGEAHAHITNVMTTQEDPPPHDPMYIMSLTGHFHKGALVAHTLSFSALASRMYVWGITARDQAGNEVWFDRELGSTSPLPSPTS